MVIAAEKIEEKVFLVVNSKSNEVVGHSNRKSVLFALIEVRKTYVEVELGPEQPTLRFGSISSFLESLPFDSTLSI